jgi:hypothetical protein
MAEQQPKDFAAGVPARSGDRDPLRRHVHDYTYLRMFMFERSQPVTIVGVAR